MRGKVPVDQCNNAATGITPAYAGKRALCFRTLSHMRDHPRVCGEKRSGKWPRHRWQGSPPRMRGKACTSSHRLCLYGITPAYAGKSVADRADAQGGRDHPRVCGEKTRASSMSQTLLGSPPRMRGKVRCYSGRLEPHGITPAYAGKRLKRSHSIGHFSCILRLFHSVLHRASASGGSRAGPCAPPCLPAQNAVPV